MSNPPIVVTGSSGFIGQAVQQELYRRGMTCAPYDRATGHDICHAFHVNEAIQHAGGVIHLAGLLGTSELMDRLHEAITVNIQGTVNIIQACARYHVPLVNIIMPYTGWKSAYQAMKQCIHDLTLTYHLYEELPCSFVRAFNAFGEEQHVHGVQKILPTFATRAWRGEPLPVWGSGSQRCDLVYVDDIARMLVDALQYTHGEVFDAGTGISHTVYSIAQRVIEYTQSSSTILSLPMRKGERESCTPPVAEGEGWDLLGWHPTFRLEDLWKTIDWYKEDRP